MKFFCEKIEDGTQFLKEGTWLEECSISFFNLKIQVKDHLTAKAADRKADVTEVLSSSEDNQPVQVEGQQYRAKFKWNVRGFHALAGT